MKKNLKDLNKEYDKLQEKYGAKELNSIYNGGCEDNPQLCFVFMNPTARNIASAKQWEGIRAPWIGTKNIWDLFFQLALLEPEIYEEIREIKGKNWTPDFAKRVYDNVKKHKYFITNLGKCTQVDARQLPNSVFYEYLDLLAQEFSIIKPKVIILFGNQVASLVLNEKIAVSQVRKHVFEKEINGSQYKFYAVYYPVGNGRFNIDKAIQDLKWIIATEFKTSNI